MLVKTYGAAVYGIEAIPVMMEVAVDPGFMFTIVGLPDAAVKESYQRIQSAIKMMGLEFPRRNIVINMSPADVKKEGAAYDLPLAIGILAGDGQIESGRLDKYMIMGELSLDGTVLPIRGVLPMAIKARSLGYKGLIVPEANVCEGAVVNNLEVYGVKTLAEVVELINGKSNLQPTVINTRDEFARAHSSFAFDFNEVKGQENVKRAFEVACAGGHNIILVGPPGSGKSMMAKRLPSILPPLTLQEALETTKIHSVAGKLQRGSMLMTVRPFRSPHHTISPVALVGGGTNPMPGEISLAHNGVLFLDEFPEFSRGVLEVMRQPLEDRHITVSRAKYTIDYPASIMLVASMNPCPCGYYNHPTKACTCPPGAVKKYMNRISGPLMDRIDIQCEIQPVPFEQISSGQPGESSAEIRSRVVRAREIQAERYKGHPEVHCNAQMSPKMLEEYVKLDAESFAMLKEAMEKFDMSARAYNRILKVARTIADLESALTPGMTLEQAVSAPVCQHHICEALGYRNLDRSSWGEYTLPSNAQYK